MKNIAFKVEDELLKKLNIAVAIRGDTISGALIKYIEEYIKNTKNDLEQGKIKGL